MICSLAIEETVRSAHIDNVCSHGESFNVMCKTDGSLRSKTVRPVAWFRFGVDLPVPFFSFNYLCDVFFVFFVLFLVLLFFLKSHL